MSIKLKLIEEVNDFQAATDEMLNKLDLIKGLTLERKKELKEELTDIVSSALQDAKHSLERDEDDPYFLSPFVIAIMYFGIVSGNIGQAEYISKLKSDYAKKRYENDIKQSEKAIVKECWDAWQKEPNQYKNNTKFASAMIDKFRPENPDDENKHLSSVKVITDWCKDWKREPF